MKFSSLSFNWVDLVIVAVILVGVFRGRKHGMSHELLPLVQWLLTIFGGAVLYKPLGKFIVDFTPFSLLTSYIMAYLLIVILFAVAFGMGKKAVGEKIFAKDLFGSMEYYLGMAAGALRFTCIIVAFLAVLNARLYSAEELAATAKMQQDSFGDISFPTLGEFQQRVFRESFLGSMAKRHLKGQLIAATPPGAGSGNHSPSLGEKKTQQLQDVIGK